MDVSVLVEDLMAYIPLPPSGARRWLPEACLNFQPGGIASFANVSAVRATDATLDRLSRDAAEFFRAQGRADFVWFIGPTSTPSGLVEQLVARGASVVGTVAAMLLDHEPEAVPDIDIRRVATPEQLLTCREISLAADGAGTLSDAQRIELAETNDNAWRDYQSYAGRRQNFLAHIDDAPVSAAGVLFTEHGVAVLSGGATLPSARGRGCYRALVHARWIAAVAAGAGPLAVQAADMSAPVLARSGFTRLATMSILRQVS
jgi:hypothetical protein